MSAFFATATYCFRRLVAPLIQSGASLIHLGAVPLQSGAPLIHSGAWMSGAATAESSL